ncbi:hypothetical protein KKG45_11200 [bacterium]|nr:hypothetical protein [bacterium]MBU1073801.1 hypothetical protein [bacterium]MBU1674656.1 hypothetical protein [bacterium]
MVSPELRDCVNHAPPTVDRIGEMIEKAMIRLLLLAAVLACMAGCGQEDVARVRGGVSIADADAAAGPVFDAQIVLCRRVGSKTGKRLDIGESFAEGYETRDRYIHAFVDFTGARAGVHQVHLVWIRPGGKELFRMFAEVRVTPAPDGYVTEIAWLNAEDLHYRQDEEPVAGATADFSLHSRLNVAPEKGRDAGAYALRVYWNRELLAERSFLFHSMDG